MKPSEEELKRMRTTPGGSQVVTGQECALRQWYVDHETGEVYDLGVTSYYHPNPLKRMLYRFLRNRGRI